MADSDEVSLAFPSLPHNLSRENPDVEMKEEAKDEVETTNDSLHPDKPIPSIVVDDGNVIFPNLQTPQKYIGFDITPQNPRGRQNLSTDASLPGDKQNVSNQLQLYRPPLAFELVTAGGRWDIERLFGPNGPFPAHLQAQLEEWHCDYPDTYPPSSARTLTPETWESSSVFDFEGDEHEISGYTIKYKRLKTGSKTIKYSVVVLHAENGKEAFVATAHKPTHRSTAENWRATYLVAWLGLKQQFEKQACAVRVSKIRENGEEVKFRPEMQHYFFKTPMLGHNAYITSVYSPGGSIRSIGSSIDSPSKHSSFSIEIPGQSAMPGSPDNTTNKRVPKTPPNRSTGQELDSEVLMSSSDSKKSGANMSPNKLGPEEYSDRGDAVSSVEKPKSMTENPGFRFKFVAPKSNKVRLFPVEGCNVETLFTKAQQFYDEMRGPLGAGLWCKIPGKNELRYIGKDCQDEFDLMCRDVGRLSLNDDEDRVIEVEPR